MGSVSRPLECAIVGAGIAGLSAGIALKRASPGHSVSIYERSSFKNEIGAAITLSPNANRILDRWGFDFVKAQETVKEQTRQLDSKTLDVIQHGSFDTVAAQYGYNFNAFHRVDLHDALRKLAITVGVKIDLGHEVVDVDCEHGKVVFKHGKELQFDLVVVADGLRSTFVQTVSGVHEPVRKIPKSVFRGLIPIEELMKDPIIRPVFEGQGSGFCTCNDPSGTMYITYPCRDDKVMNVAVFHTTRPGHENDEGWHSPATVDEVLSVLGGLHPAWHAITKKLDQWTCFPIVMREPIPRYNNGKVILIGDSAHPMQPTHAQGGCLAIEDAAALEVLFKDFDASTESVAKRLELFNQLRLPRGNTTQLFSNIMFYHPNGTAQDKEEYLQKLRTYYSGPLMNMQAKAWGVEHREFFYPYDVHKEAEKAMRYKDAEGGVPDGVISHFYK